MVFVNLTKFNQYFVSLFYRDYDCKVSEKLHNLEIREDSVLQFSLSSFHYEAPEMNKFCQSDITPSVKQTEKGLSAFFSALNAIVSFLF